MSVPTPLMVTLPAPVSTKPSEWPRKNSRSVSAPFRVQSCGLLQVRSASDCHGAEVLS
jgi:hypothetical protein